MIGLKISGKNAEMNPGTSISMKLVNPIFNDDNLSPGSYSMPFELPGGEVSPVNAAIFKNPDVIENVEEFVKQDADLSFDGVLFKKGKIRLKSVSPKILSAHFTFGLSAISDEFKTKKLRDLLDEVIVIDNTAITKKIYLKQNGTFSKPFPIIVNGKNYEADTMALMVSAINANTDLPKASALLVTDGISSGGLAAPYMVLSSATSTTDPLTELSVDVDTNNFFNTGTSENELKWQVHGEIGDIENDAYYNPFWTSLQGYFTGAYPDQKLRFPAVFNTALTLYNGLMMDGANPTLIRNEVAPDNSFRVNNRNSVHPFVRVKWVLDRIATYFGVQLDGDFYNSGDTDEMLIWNPNSLDLPLPYIGKTPFIFWKRSFNVKDLVPDITVVALLKALQSRYNLAVYFNERTGKVLMSMRENIAKSVLSDDITPRCSPVMEVDDMAITGAKLSATREEDDLVATDDFLDIGDPETELKTKLSALQSFTTRATLGGDVLGPEVIHPPDSAFEVRVFYYKGLFNNGTLSYPQAHINATNYSEGFPALYEYFWKRWIAYVLRRKLVKVEIEFPIGDLLAFDWELKRRFDRNNYLVKSLDFALTPRGLTVCKAELYTMR